MTVDLASLIEQHGESYDDDARHWGCCCGHGDPTDDMVAGTRAWAEHVAAVVESHLRLTRDAELDRLRSEMRMRELHHFETEAENQHLRSDPRTPRGVIARAADYIGHVPPCADDDCLACDLRALLTRQTEGA